MDTSEPPGCLARIELVGTPRLLLRGDVVQPLERKEAALLALLALEGPTPRGRAAGLLWADADRDAARNSLRQRLHRLRKRAGFELVVTSHDVLHLAAEVDGSRPASHDGDAVGELLGAFNYDDCEALGEWVAAARARLRGARREACAAAAARLEREGRIGQALPLAEQLLSDDPLLEHSHRRLMRLHYLRGDRAAALAAFRHCRDLLRRELKVAPGKETLELAALVESSGRLPQPAPAPTPVAVMRPPRLVGRAEEWRALEQGWRQRRPMLVVGEPGIGKSRLLGEFGAAHAAIVVGARPGDETLPYALLARLLRALGARCEPVRQDWARRELARLVPEVDPEWIAVGDINPARLAQAIELQLASLAAAAPAGDAPCGFVVEDLQFADAESVHLLRLVAQSVPLAWLFSARTQSTTSPAPAWLALAEPATARRLGLQPLDAAATLELMQSLELAEVDAAALAGRVHRHTGGNPMFVLETLSALLAAPSADRAAAAAGRLPIPDSVGQLIETRLAKLSPPALKLARVAVLSEEDFSLELAAAVLELHPLDLAEPWLELAQAQVMRDEGFAHDLVLEATRRSIPAALEEVMHRTIARCLAARSAAPDRIARHWRLARAWPQAADAYLQAAERALALSRRAEELALLRSAADCLGHAPTGDEADAAPLRFEVALRSARASLLVDRADEARRFGGEALLLAQDARQRAAALAACAEIEDFVGDVGAAIDHASEGLHLAKQLDDAALELAHASLLGKALAARGDFAGGCAVFDAHGPRIGAAGAAGAARAFLLRRAVVLDQARRREEAIATGLEALERARAAQDDSSACLCHIHLASFHARLGNGGAALDHARRAVQLGERIGHSGGQSEIAEVYLGVMSAALGQFGQAVERLDAAQQRLGQGRAAAWAVIARGVLARTWIILGQPARGWPLLADEVLGVPDSVRGLQLVNLVRLLRVLGKPRARPLAQAQALFAREAQHEGDLLVQLEQALDAQARDGATIAASVEAQAEQRMHRPLQLDAQVVGCSALLAAGAIDAAAQKARAALRLAGTSITWTIYRAEVGWRAHQALAAAGAEDEALAALREAKAWVEATLPSVPDPFRDSFLHRNAVNQALLSAARRKLAAG